jgi:hypothetical protein
MSASSDERSVSPRRETARARTTLRAHCTHRAGPTPKPFLPCADSPKRRIAHPIRMRRERGTASLPGARYFTSFAYRPDRKPEFRVSHWKFSVPLTLSRRTSTRQLPIGSRGSLAWHGSIRSIDSRVFEQTVVSTNQEVAGSSPAGRATSLSTTCGERVIGRNRPQLSP